MYIYILKFARHFCDTVWRTVTLLLHKLSSRSDGNTADKKGDKCYPYCTPIQHEQNTDVSFHDLTHDIIQLYIDDKVA